MKKKVLIVLLFVLFIALFMGFIYKIETQKDKIGELNLQLEESKDIEKPMYSFENKTFEQHFFKYSGLEFSSFMNRKDFYGLHIIDMDKSDIDLRIYCKINESLCKVEFKDIKCLNDYLGKQDIRNITIRIGEINCSRYYTIKGNVSERIY